MTLSNVVHKKRIKRNNLALLLADTNGTATATGSLGVLTAHTQTPVVTQTTVGADTLETLEILTDLAVEGVGDDLGVLAVGDVALSVQEPCGDLVLGGVLEDGDHTLEFFGGELTGAAIVKISLGPFAIPVLSSYQIPVDFNLEFTYSVSETTYRLLRSTSAFLQTKLE